MCTTHHNATKQRMEAEKGGAPGADTSGLPLDHDHPWSVQRRMGRMAG
jgi:hypothetical protein